MSNGVNRALRQRRLTERHERQFRDMRRTVISIGVQLEGIMVECGWLEPEQRQVLTSEQVRRTTEDGQAAN